MDGKSLSIIPEIENHLKPEKSTHFKHFKDLEDHENIFNLSTDCEIIAEDPKKEFKELKKRFKYIKAAGGIVHFANKFLFIFRNGKWDLPKGKIEHDEKPKIAALREIHEECGLVGHQLQHKICNTYHTYTQNNEPILKKTYWYHFKINDLTDSNLQPQIEEGITDLRWFSWEELDEVRQNTFDSIHVVLNEFDQLRSLHD